MKFVFSKVSVRNPDLPLGTHHDEKQRGLVLNITASSRKFGVYISVRNIPTRKSIGDIDHLSVEAARLRAAEIIQELKTQPKGPKVPTLGDLAAAYVRELEKKGRRMPEYVSDTVRLSWTHLKGRKIDTITKEELRECGPLSLPMPYLPSQLQRCARSRCLPLLGAHSGGVSLAPCVEVGESEAQLTPDVLMRHLLAFPRISESELINFQMVCRTLYSGGAFIWIKHHNSLICNG